MQARLASLEAEAAELRAEVAGLQDDLRWLAGLDDEADDEAPGFLSRGWLAAGWARASLLLASVGLVALVSAPYLSHLLDPSGSPDLTPVAAAESAPAVTARPASAPVPATAPREEYIAAPARAAAVPAPARLGRPAPTRVRAAVVRQHSRFVDGPDGAVSGGAPLVGESP
jgi:hypothetical protein